MSEIKFEVIPHYVDEIIINNLTKKDVTLINKAVRTAKSNDLTLDYQFDDNGECPIEMEFYDGIALATDGCGLYLTYPKLEEIAKSPARQESIQDYTGIYDGTINQHDVALRYGVLKFDEKRNKMSISGETYGLEHETIILMSADIYQDTYNMDNVYDFSLAARLVRDAALRFEKKWNDEMKGNDGYDYIMEMDRFEQEELERLRKIYDEN
jgi:hypothetical protein